MLNSRVFTLSIFSDQNCINIIIKGFVTCNRAARSNISKKIESIAESEIQRYIAFSDSVYGVISFGIVVLPSFN
jgi:hypothetical protein